MAAGMEAAARSEQAAKVRLYSYAMSPYAAKVHCFLLFKRIPFELFYINPLRVKQDLPVGRQIPVLTIDGESRADSTPIGLWLEEAFPNAPALLPEAQQERERVLAIDGWITDTLIPCNFRAYPGDGLDWILNAWKLSHVMGYTARGGLPWLLRKAWPLVIRRVGFVRQLLAQADDGLPPRESMRKRYADFEAYLGNGPFLAGRAAPSFADVAAYPQFALYYVVGFRGAEDIERHPAIMSWLARMAPFLRGSPSLVPPHLRVRTAP